MKVIERVEQLQAELQDINEKYCDNCQEFLCEYCPIVWKGEEDGKQTQTAYLQNRAV